MKRHLWPFLALPFCAACAFAQGVPASASASAPSVAQLEAIVVHGVQPGPGMWRVSKDDHVMWVLGTLSPLPKNISWQSHDVETAVAQSQEVLTAPEVSLSTSAGIFSQLALLPALIGVRKNPDNRKLKDVVPATLYARWTDLKARYIGRNAGIEKWRPIFAAIELYDSAIEKMGLVDSSAVQKKVIAMAKRSRIEIRIPRISLVIDDPRSAIKEFKSESLDDLDCFSKTLDRIETDLSAMAARANAWATGDLDALRALPYTNQMTACAAAITQASLARKQGMADAESRVEQVWLDAATTALTNNRVTFAVLPIRHVIAPDGYLFKLSERGYTIEAPGIAAIE